MKLIITGHDFSGKSTFLHALYDRLKDDSMSFLHLSYREPTSSSFYEATLNFSNFLMDRAFLDECIYPEVFNRTANLTEEEVQYLFSVVEDKGITLLIFECSDEEISKRISGESSEEPEVISNLFNIKHKYREFANKYNLPCIDTTNKTFDELYTIVEAFINESNSSCR